MKASLGIVCVLILVFATSHCSLAAVPPMINYQGKLMQPNGVPVTDGTYSIKFSIYDAPAEGNTLWSEINPAVQVKGGIFAVMLGSVVNLPANIFDAHERWFAVKVNSDPEMVPRQKIAGVAYASRAASADVALTVPDGSITAPKLAPGIAVPPGTIVMWSGSTGSIPLGWTLCNGQNGTPDLRDRFIVGAGGTYAVAATGGEATHVLTMDEMPGHTHTIPAKYTTNADHTHFDRPGFASEAPNPDSGVAATISTSAAGGAQAHENRPPYYALCFIMKLAY